MALHIHTQGKLLPDVTHGYLYMQLLASEVSAVYNTRNKTALSLSKCIWLTVVSLRKKQQQNASLKLHCLTTFESWHYFEINISDRPLYPTIHYFELMWM